MWPLISGERTAKKTARQSGVQNRHALIEAAQQAGVPLSIRQLCRILQVNRAWFYAHRRLADQQASREAREQVICQAIQLCREQWKSYGYRRVTAALRREGLLINHKRVWRLMHQHSWGCRRSHQRICTTRKGLGRYLPNILRDRAASAPNQIWVTDITYIRLPGHFVYLATLLDAFSRVWVGWQLAETLDDQIVLDAFEQACKQRAPAPGLIVHRDSRKSV